MLNGTVEKRQDLRSKKRWSEDAVFSFNGGISFGEAEAHIRTDHVLGHQESSPFDLHSACNSPRRPRVLSILTWEAVFDDRYFAPSGNRTHRFLSNML